MSCSQEQHQIEIHQNLDVWGSKPLLRQIYAEFYKHIKRLIAHTIPGEIVEVGSGMGNLKAHLPNAICTDLFSNPWLDLVCDGYELPFRSGTISHLVLMDVFHHLQAPKAFFHEAHRVLSPHGRVILFEPYISWMSWPVYGIFHHEPIQDERGVSMAASPPRPRAYYASQGNATRLFFTNEPDWLPNWRAFHRESFACFSYLLSGGFSKPAIYPASWWPKVKRFDDFLTRWPKLFGGRCLIGLERNL